MARKKQAKRRGTHRPGTLQTVRALTRRAKTESAKLLRRSRAGTITRRDLDSGLKDLTDQLAVITIHEHWL